MKKIILLIVVVLVVIGLNSISNKIIIPKDAIRFRVIANSNSKEDQNIKKIISTNLQQELYPKLLKADNKNEAQNIINKNMSQIDTNIKNTLKKNNNQTNYNINYGINHFPEKIYKGVEYPEGDYESLVVTLGNGTGNNWWCVLFPPLCLLEAEENNTSEVEYKSFIKELIDKYL